MHLVIFPKLQIKTYLNLINTLRVLINKMKLNIISLLIRSYKYLFK